jgi:hypothetical protein
LISGLATLTEKNLIISNCIHEIMSLQTTVVGWFMVFNTTFSNISVMLWQSILLVKETGVPEENQQPVASH